MIGAVIIKAFGKEIRMERAICDLMEAF